MNKNRSHHILLLISAWFLCLGFWGCSAGWKEEYRQKGFTYHQLSFNMYPETPDLYRVVKIGDVFFHFCGSRKYFDAQYRDSNDGVMGYAYEQRPGGSYSRPAYHVYLLAKIYRGQILYDPAVLGHELGHILDLTETSFVNPDKIKELDALN